MARRFSDGDCVCFRTVRKFLFLYYKGSRTHLMEKWSLSDFVEEKKTCEKILWPRVQNNRMRGLAYTVSFKRHFFSFRCWSRGRQRWPQRRPGKGTFVSARYALAACLRRSSCERTGQVKMQTNGLFEGANERNTADAAGREEW